MPGPAVEPTTPDPSARIWIAYVAPMAAFMLLTYLEGMAPLPYPLAYACKIAVVAALLIAYRSAWRDIRLEPRTILPAVLTGLAVIVSWVLLTKHVPWATMGPARTAFDPFARMPEETSRAAFLAVRLVGLVVVVPVMEELFWRSFLIRYFTQADWRAVPVGAFSWTAFGLVAGGFAIAHPEWLAAAVCACAYGLLLRHTRSLFACVVAHATSNLALGIYVLVTHDWTFW